MTFLECANMFVTCDDVCVLCASHHSSFNQQLQGFVVAMDSSQMGTTVTCEVVAGGRV